MSLSRLRLLAESLVLLARPSTWRDPYASTPSQLSTILESVPDAETPERIEE
jgi:hypothetical protein